ncbi:MAG: DUF368 domain-containing protein [Actinomycetota bacterium]
MEKEKNSDAQNPVLGFFGNLIRGFLIGTAEIIPGISGGTIALITGVYDRVINSAAEGFKAFILLFSFSKNKWLQAAARFRTISWLLLIPLLIGMITAIFLAAGFIEGMLSDYPSITRAFFAGLIIASLAVPIRLSGGKWGFREYLIAAASALVALLLTSLPKAADVNPSFWVILGSAAVAVCALVLPGISGSYLLLALGMYAPTLQAVNDRDFAYLGTFILGALIGLGSFVSLLEWLLENARRTTLVVMTGLMVGSLRALWPWQGSAGEIQIPTSGVILEILMVAAGATMVVAISYLAKRFEHSN